MIAIVDYNAGNLTSVGRALKYVGYDYIITSDPKKVINAGRVIFPGVGAAGAAMKNIKSLQLDKALIAAFETNKPMLGICLGSQIIMSKSQENNQTCLKIIDGYAKSFSENAGLKIPHMGWNGINIERDHPIFSGLKKDAEFYFVHGFYPSPKNQKHIFATTDYGMQFPSVVGNGSLIATQFHIEKSGEAGLKMISNFCNWKPL
jgi:glutamine amidotransferase